MRSLAILALVFLATVSTRAKEFIVHPDGSGDYATIQAAVDAATEGDTITLTAGTFFGAGNRDIDFEGKNLIVHSSSDDPADVAIDCTGPTRASHRAFSFHSGETIDSAVRGITVRNGSFTWGAGIFIQGASPRIEDCVIEHCVGLAGAGILVSDSQSILARCAFVQNHADGGGGAVFFTTAGTPGKRVTALLSECLLEANSADNSGGAVLIGSVPAQIENCTFYGNSCGEDGAAFFVNTGGMATVTNTIIAGGTAGGAYGCQASDAATFACTDIWGNAGGDWGACAPDALGKDGNISEDPDFCAAADHLFTLRATSGCAPAHSGGCGLIGARPVACAPLVAVCCHGGICDLMSEPDCSLLDGIWSSELTSCDPSPCDPWAACCTPGVCALVPAETCALAGGTWHRGVGCGGHHDCADLRACCVAGVCHLMWSDECLVLGGTFRPAIDSCAPDPCATSVGTETWGSIKSRYLR
jgi:hypothetical protein